MKSRVIIVSGLHADLTEDHLYDLFDAYGCIEDVRLFVDEEDGRSLGYGEVIYASSDCAMRALRECEGLEIWGERLSLRPASYIEEEVLAQMSEQEPAFERQGLELGEGSELSEEEFRFVSEITLPLWAREELLDDALESA